VKGYGKRRHDLEARRPIAVPFDSLVAADCAPGATSCAMNVRTGETHPPKAKRLHISDSELARELERDVLLVRPERRVPVRRREDKNMWLFRDH
jgi:hypothetical protein